MVEVVPLREKVAVVTGSSSGIGRAIALALAKAGADVVIHARQNREGAQETVGLARNHGVDGDVMLADLSQSNEVRDFADKVWKWRNGVDVLVNNAGADTLTGAAASWNFEQKLDSLWRVDVAATVMLTRLIGSRMKSRGRGVIINIGWDQAEVGMEGDSGELFSTTKGAVMAFTRSAAQSLAPEVRVNCVAPGWIKTHWGESASDAWQKRAVRESLSNRWGTPEDIARAVLFLALPAASFVNGQVWAVNGGLRRS